MLLDLFDSLSNQTLAPDNFEVIIVDNGSNDDTKKICKSFQKQIKNYTYIYEKQPGLHRGRHAGLRKAIADILVFADDDVIAFPTWLEGVLEAFLNTDVMLVGGKSLPLFESEPPKWLRDFWMSPKSGKQILPFLSLIDLGDSKKVISPYNVFGCNFSIRKHVLLEAGGFHPDAMPSNLIRYRGDGETYISQFLDEKGYKTLYHPKASVFHRVSNERMTEQYLCRRSYEQGISDSYTQIRNRGINHHWFILFFKAIKRLPMFFKNPLQAKAFKSYIKGYHFHRREVYRDPELFEWVNRKNYLK
jgi:glycosyltransferase involved in cell wall biosynthesis